MHDFRSDPKELIPPTLKKFITFFIYKMEIMKSN